MATKFFYLLGFGVVILGVAMGLNLLGVSREWILVLIVILAGIAIISASSRSGERSL